MRVRRLILLLSLVIALSYGLLRSRLLFYSKGTKLPPCEALAKENPIVSRQVPKSTASVKKAPPISSAKESKSLDNLNSTMNSTGSRKLGSAIFHGDSRSFMYFEDYVQSLVVALQTIGYHAEIKLHNPEIWNRDGVHSSIPGVHLFLQTVPKRNLPVGSFSVLINTEQMTRAHSKKITSAAIMSDPTLILADYSRENPTLLGVNHSSTRVVYLPYQVNMAEIRNLSSPARSVAFTGTNTQYRRQIHSTVGTKVTTVGGWGLKRDQTVFDHKILLNVEAAGDYQVFEEMRCFRAIVNKQIVVTTSRLNLSNHPLRNFFVACCAKDLKATVSRILANYSSFQKQLFDEFDLDAIRVTRLTELSHAFAQITGRTQSVESTTRSTALVMEPLCR